MSADVSSRLADIDRHAHQVRDVITEIASANAQQAEGVRQITEAIEQVGRITSDTAGNAEQSQQIAVELSTAADRMATLLADFTVRGAHTAGRTIRPEARSRKPVLTQHTSRVLQGR